MHKLALLFAFVVLAAVLSPTTGLTCYGCIYYKGVEGSTDDCKADVIVPGYDRACTALNSVLIDSRTGAILNKTTSTVGVKAIGDFMCVKMSGRDKTTGAAVLYRDCGLQVTTNEDRTCSHTTEDLSLAGFGIVAAGAQQHKCTQSLCNDGSVDAACDDSSGATPTAGTKMTHQTLTGLLSMFLVSGLAKFVL